MYILLPCPTIRDTVLFQSKSPETQGLMTQANKWRSTLKSYSDIEFLFKKIQDGELIITKKIDFDNYMKSQVDIMRACFFAGVACPFTYNGYMNSEEMISTAGLGVKEQWAIEMVMSRYNIASIYHAAAYSNLEYIFTETAASYEKVKDSPKFITNIQAAFKYFNEGYQPLKRLADAYPTLEQLFKDNKILQVRKEVFVTVKDLIAINLCYLKLQKYRVMCEYRSAKEGAYSVYNSVKEIVKRLKSVDLLGEMHADIKIFLTLSSLFFQAYAYYFLLQEHEDMKNREEYGFIKKEFQVMILENSVVCEEFIKLAHKVDNFPNKDSLDSVIFANGVIQAMLVDVKKKQYAYGISVHENKEITKPTIEEIVEKRIAHREIFTMIGQF